MSNITIDTKRYERELREYVLGLAEWSFRNEQKKFEKQYDLEEMARGVERFLDRPHAGDPFRKRDIKGIQAVILEFIAFRREQLARRELDPDSYALSKEVMDFWDTLKKDRPRTQEESEAEALQDFHRVLKGTEQNAQRVKQQVAEAIRRVPTWDTPSIIIQASFNKDTAFDPSTSFMVGVGRHQASFSLFINEQGKAEGIDDVLESGDTNFFPPDALQEQADYFSLVKELQHPGSSAQGKRLSLWTARPIKDRHIYEKARTVPPNIFLTTDQDRAIGLARDLGGGHERDVWHVWINSRYLVQTLDAGQIKDYQVVGDRPVPVERIELEIEGGQKLASRVAARYISRVINQQA